MKLLIDMNLSPDWVETFRQQGWQAVHWSVVGDPKAPDGVIMAWARQNGYIVFTHDLDFGALLAATGALGSSVVQIRVQDVMPDHLGDTLVQVLQQHEATLAQGALISVDATRSRIHILPLRRNP